MHIEVRYRCDTPVPYVVMQMDDVIVLIGNPPLIAAMPPWLREKAINDALEKLELDDTGTSADLAGARVIDIRSRLTING